jgi:hypothetical protein
MRHVVSTRVFLTFLVAGLDATMRTASATGLRIPIARLLAQSSLIDAGGDGSPTSASTRRRAPW